MSYKIVLNAILKDVLKRVLTKDISGEISVRYGTVKFKTIKKKWMSDSI